MTEHDSVQRGCGHKFILRSCDECNAYLLEIRAQQLAAARNIPIEQARSEIANALSSVSNQESEPKA